MIFGQFRFTTRSQILPDPRPRLKASATDDLAELSSKVDPGTKKHSEYAIDHHLVGEKKPNPWGLYDMHGNVYEWCHDWYGDHPSGSVTDPTGAASGRSRVLRGGSFITRPSNVRSANRNSDLPDIRSDSLGFRPARTYNLSR